MNQKAALFVILCSTLALCFGTVLLTQAADNVVVYEETTLANGQVERTVSSAPLAPIINHHRSAMIAQQANVPLSDEVGAMLTSRTQGGNIAGVDGGKCAYPTILAAIAAIPNGVSGATIYIEHGTYSEILGEIDKDITFVPAQPNSDCRDEDLGAESNAVIITGSDGSDDGTGGLVEITDGSTVTFRHMWLRDATATNGGIIAVTNGSTLILDDALVTDGDATSSGGNIYAIGTAGNPSVVKLLNDSSVYRGNTTLGDGGAISLFNSDLLVTDSNIGVSSNNGFSTAGNNGGGVYASDSTIDISGSNSDVIWNEAGVNGGGIYADDTTITIRDARISFNTGNYRGGGIYMDGSSSLNVDDATFDANNVPLSDTNSGGGAVYALRGNLHFDNTVFTRNTSANSGGAINGLENSDITLTNGTIISGNVGLGGGGVVYRNILTVDNTQVLNNEATAFGGGGLRCFVCEEVTLGQNSNVALNRAPWGGGLYFLGDANIDDSDVTITGANISINETNQSQNEGKGGGIYFTRVRLTISNTLIFSNNTDWSGGGIYGYSDQHGSAILTVTNSTIANNSTTVGESGEGGGGIFLEDHRSRLYLKDSDVRRNESANLGGGIGLRNGPDSVIVNSKIYDNSASFGAGFYSNSGDHLIENSEIYDNDASGPGGGLYFNTSNSIVLRNNQFYDNIADNGAGLYLWFNEAFLDNNTFTGNHARNHGGGIYVDGATVWIGVDSAECQPLLLPANTYCSEFRGNSAEETGGGIYVLGGTVSSFDAFVHIEHTAFLQNTAVEGGTAIELQAEFTPTVRITNTLIAENGVNDGSNIPTLRNEGNGRLFVHSSTLAGNYGSPLWVVNELHETEIRNSIMYLNALGPFVRIASGSFTQSCNNSQFEFPGSSYDFDGPGNPQFDGTHPRGDYRLGASSPSIDACTSGVSHDADLNSRPAGSSFDQGAFETGAAPTAVGLTVQAAGIGQQVFGVLLVLLVGLTGWVFRPKSSPQPSS